MAAEQTRLEVMIQVGMSASCVYPLGCEEGFKFAQEAGYDGLELMVTREPVTQNAQDIKDLISRFDMPVLSIHAPVLLLTHFVWGRDPQIKLEKSAELAAEVGADTVVVHPPFRWQSGYAEKFLDIVRSTSNRTGITIAVENMFPWKIRNSSMQAYAPGPDPRELDCDAITLDFSHAALSGHNSLELAQDYGTRLRHVHLTDGSSVADGNRVFDEHLLPGYGKQPVAEVLQYLATQNWNGHVVAEVNTRKAKTETERLDMLKETLAFARTHLGQNISVWN